MSYNRVLPRDLFNEAKLLKCVGMVCLAIHDNKAGSLEMEHDGEAFDVVLLDEGALEVSNINFSVDGETVNFISTYNSKANHPLQAIFRDEYFDVFTDEGEQTEEFRQMCGLELATAAH